MDPRIESFRREHAHEKGGRWREGSAITNAAERPFQRWDLIGKCIFEESRKCTPESGGIAQTTDMSRAG